MVGPSNSEIGWLENSRVDPQGNLFCHDGRLFRAMKRFDRDYYANVLRIIGHNESLHNRTVPTQLSSIQLVGFSVILEHEVVRPFTWPSDWSSAMFRKAALCHLHFHLELARYSYSLQDAHPWNVTFKNTDPVYVDFGSIIPEDSAELRLGLLFEYYSYFVFPLFLMSKGQAEKARRYLNGSNPPLGKRDLVGYLTPFEALEWWFRVKQAESRSRKSLIGLLETLLNQVERLDLPQKASSWTGYHDDETSRTEQQWHGKQKSIDQIIQRLRPETLLDVGCATGWYSFQAAHRGSRVIAIDTDDQMVNYVHGIAARKRLPLVALVGDIFGPNWETERVVSDMVLALALTHHLYFTQGYRFDYVARILASHTRRWLVTEYIGQEDPFVQQKLGSEHKDYTLDGFVDVLRRHFHSIEKYASSSENRVILLCEK